MIAERIAAIEHETLIIDVEGADQDGAQVGWEYTATGMRFFIRGALAATLRALASRAEFPADVTVLVEEAREFAGKSMRLADAYRDARLKFEAETHANFFDLVNRLAAALTAQAERAP